MKRVFALLLALAMLLGLMPTAMAAEAEQEASGTTVQATELSGVSRLDSTGQADARQPAASPRYQDDDIVTVIVQLEEPSLLDYYSQMGGQAVFGADSSSGEAYTAGEAVSAFLELPEVQAIEEDMLAGQQAFLGQIGSPQAAAFSAVRGAGTKVEVVAQWTAVLNGMAIRVPYGSLASIRAMDGVKRAYVQHVYAAPEPVIEGAGAAGFSYDMVGLGDAWSAGYTGKGMLVAVVDTGLDLEYASFAVDDPDSPGGFVNIVGIRRTHESFREESFKTTFDDSELRYTKASIESFLSGHTLQAHKIASPNAVDTAAYKNRKVVYAFDYVGKEYSVVPVGDVNVYPGQFGNTHGTHVAGTVAGYAETDEGAVIFSGIAPDAQLAIMKVFPDDGSGAPESTTMNALEDAMRLGADVVNLSLGSDNGYADDDSAQAQVYDSVQKAGVVIMAAAGNSAFSSSRNQWGGYNLTADPEISMVGSPSVYPSALSVASINNTVNSQMTLVWSDGENEYTIPFTDPFDDAMKSTFAPANVPEEGIALIPAGEGSWNDYSSAGFNNGWNNGKNGIALVKRGGNDPYTNQPLSFVDKVKNASSFTGTNYMGERYGVRAVIIYDNVEGDLIHMSISLNDAVDVSSAFISKEAGDAMIAAIEGGKTVTLKYVNQEDEIVDYAGGYEMSSFTSWGAAPGLELKPEITAPGGNIWSTVFDTSYNQGGGLYDDYIGAYEMMSGTSMATPHMSGLGALVRQYVKDQDLAAGRVDTASLTNWLLVSTAVPQLQKEKDADKTAFYSPRRQGAGLVNIGSAITTPAYITVDGQLVGKLELKDDPDWTGSYDLEFKVHNLTGSAVTYTAQAVMQRPGARTEDGHDLMLDSDVLIKTVDLGAVTVPANGTITVEKTIALTQSEIDALEALFPNGTYIEGFITLTGSDESVPQIGLPYLGFLGDWTAPPIFDSVMWYDQAPDGWEKENDDDPDWNPWDNGEYTWYPSLLGSCLYNEGYHGIKERHTLGQNLFELNKDDPQLIFHKGNFTLSPNGDGYFDAIDDIELYQLRDAKLIVVQVRDAETNKLYFRDFATYNFKTLFDSSAGAAGAAVPTSIYYFTEKDWDGTDLNGNLLPSGTKCTYTITAYGEGEYGDKVAVDGYDYPVTDFEFVDPTRPRSEPTFNGHPMDKTGDVISIPVVVDYVAPKLVNNAISIVERDGRVYLSGTAYDEDGSIASIEVVPVVTRTRKYDSESETTADLSNPFYSKTIYDEAVKEWSFEADVTEYVHRNESYPGENYSFDFTWTGAVYVFCGDYGSNDRAYAVAVKGMATPGELLLSHTSAKLHPGSAFELSVTDNTGSGAPIVRTSTNPEVATVDEFGVVTAVAPGQATIVVTNGAKSTYCVVAVENWPTEVIDFDLSIESFVGLKPNGIVTVKVTNLQPADVILDEVRWEVFEDDPDSYIGLINCEKNTGDSLSGRLWLNYAATMDPEIHVPGADGTLKVTLNGVTREMKISWEDLYTYYSVEGGAKDEDLISAFSEKEHVAYVTMGETAKLVAIYNDSNAHNVVPIELYTAAGDLADNQLNSTDPAVGLILDGKTFATSGNEWSGKLVNTEGYALPESIRIFTLYSGSDYSYEIELTNQWTQNFTYDPATGEVSIKYPYHTMIIRADGVEAPDNPAGALSGDNTPRPDGLYGPFDWSMTEGMASVGGELEPFENGLLLDGYSYGNGAYFTPGAPGVSYITAASKDGKYSVNFAVVCMPVKAEKLDLDQHSVELGVGNAAQLTASFTPDPTLPSDKELVWKSFDPDVAEVDDSGVITAKSEGYAYIKAAVKTDTTVESYCVVKVSAGLDTGSRRVPITYELNGGDLSGAYPVAYITTSQSQTLNVPEPTRTGCTFLGWTWAGQGEPVKTVILPAGFSSELTLTANWEEPSVPVVPTVPDTPAPQPPAGVSTDDKQGDDVTVTETTAVPDSTAEGGSASAGVSAAMGDEIVRQAVSNESDTVVIAPEMDGSVTSAEVSVPAGTVSELAEKTGADVRIETPVATVVIPNEALAELAAEGGQVSVSAQRADSGTVEVTVKANGRQVDSVTGGMTVTVPQEDCGPGTVAMLVLEDGSTQVIRQSLSSEDGQSINIPLDGSAKLVIVDNSQTFTDVSDSNWAADAVAFVSSHELMNGVGGGAFDPKASMTRGMLAMVLHNLEYNQKADANTVFSDVRDDAWYSDAIRWAAGKGIVNGYPDGSFAPKASISREQLAVMLYRYAGSPEVSGGALDFTDAGDISGYAEEAMAWAVENHILQGKGNGVLDPKGNATRAETAQMLLNFMTHVIW